MSDFPAYGLPHAEIPGCALVQDLLPLYLEGDVTHESHVLIADHLQHCERCSGFLAGAQSVRREMLREQQAIRAAQATGPTVAQIQQPVVDSLGHALWIGLMALSWLGGLLGIFVGVAAVNVAPLVVGVGLLFSGVAGLLFAGQAHRLVWKLLCVPTGLLGLVLLGHMLSERWNYWTFGLVPLFVGAPLLALAGWGLVADRGRSRQPAENPRQGAGLAVGTAIVGLLAAAALLLITSGGLALIAFSPSYQVRPQFFGILLAMAGALGLVELNTLHRWLPTLAAPVARQRTQALIVIAGGIIWSMVGLRTGIIGVFSVVSALRAGAFPLAFILACAIGLGLLLVLLRWFGQRG